ncbi:MULTISPECIES: TatD family hydrolase [Bacillus]|uniref:TatD family deoxyribonuclease n=3 Tax=Bacillus cereus group TaxID=86661 RepID=A0AAP8EY08_9BACI|nr:MULTISPECIES: TatD family hydrolase [Bacillus]KXY42839.1 DNAase [Bacillus cereus]EJQ34291.1 TatD family hydrolase [Bacillus toyonensis]KAB2354144.1 TatD family deoxyribonuclease [Bacillus toyonensis]KAB2379684.1 TatD family deoxyribonuclease [Bacillus toyonensis]MBF7149707.1 TatD family hydrolase [Bacillus toyonensis]
MKWIDSHIHVDQYKDEEKSRLLKDLENSKEVKGLIAVSMNYQSCKETLSLGKKFPFIHPAIGFHPEQPIHKEECERIFKLIEAHAEEIIAIGEVGLPYYLTKEDEGVTIDSYVAILRRFIELASEYDLPIVLHAVYEDADIVCDLLEEYKISRAHFHWFKGNEATMGRMVRNGYYISITPDVLHKEKIRKIVSYYPLEYMMVETDGPWEFQENTITHPCMIKDVLEEVSVIKKIPVEKVAEQIYKNTVRFYRLTES